MKCGIIVFVVYFTSIIFVSLGFEQKIQQSGVENVKCKEFILEKLNLDDLLDIANTNEYCKRVAAEVFKNKYANKQMKLCKQKGDSSEEENLLHISCESVTKFFNTFGYLSNRLALYLNIFPNKEQVVVMKAVNEYCYNLQELQVSSFIKAAFIDMKNPWEKLTTFILEKNKESEIADDGSLDLIRIFPALRRFHVQVYSDDSMFNRHFPHLIEFHPKLYAQKADEIQYTTFFEKNPQIQSMSMDRYNISLLQGAYAFLPRLKELSLNLPENWKSYGGPQLDFSSVEKLTVIDRVEGISTGKLAFKHIDTLDATITGRMGKIFDEEWISFIKTLQQLKSLTIKEIDNAGLSNLAKNVNTLTEATVLCQGRIHSDPIVEIIKNNANMQRFIVNIRKVKYYSDVLDGLRKNLASEWKIDFDVDVFVQITLTKNEPGSSGLNETSL